ncbi:UDP-N-acetylglucosamine 2-epimerase (hydrolyzing) [Marivirga sp. S37H4]|uniref:UDP-N-acetylglucosamine 2-epimerase (Hydrolyzing) n=1 Tax=Marivirga aurantiaca TaxID=2802615 RepID=A0A934WWX9_9BACT|nr:UDP-N-acetylglucosamine 2-epimerase [Marivirga aurantiaca]MBK6264514.1 UDP-N-acetylglucosamine 2-epimerase (hydrolyzing) [Marivirga aurantiaca]
MRKICIVTGTRAEFGLMYWLIKGIQEDMDLELQLVVTGMHLSPEFGLTYQNIEESGFIINKKVEILLSSDSPIGISKSMGLAMISFSECFEELKPDIVVVLGDRFEIFSVAAAAMITKIPIGHIHGGEATEGLIDESIRHSVTKMAHLHFAATELYKKRIIQLGEQPNKVFNVGSPGIDNIAKLNLLNRNEFQDAINFKLGKINALVTFHPVTLENNTTEFQFNELLNAIELFPELSVIFTKPNADTNGRVIISMIDEFVQKNPKKYCGFTSLGQLRYLSSLKHVDIVIGNSSSGLTEVPSFKIPTVNIGDRQKGRMKARSVLDCLPEKDSISVSIKKALSSSFMKEIENVENPYGDGGASDKIIEVLKSVDLNNILKKEFYNL